MPVSVQSRFEAVAKGRADMECGSSAMTLGRMKEVDFSSVRPPACALADPSGMTIAVVAGTTNELPFKSRDEAFAALEESRADAFASDRLLLIGASAKATDQGALALLADQLSFEPYGIVLPRGDAALRLAVNTGLAHIYNGEEIVEIYRRWFARFGRPSPIVEAAFILGAIPD